MAKEIIVKTSIACANGSFVMPEMGPGIQYFDQAAQGRSANTQTIGTTQEALVIGSDIAVPGVAYFRNIDPTNYIELGLVVSATFYPFAKIKPGEAYVLRIAAGAAYYAKANTTAAKLDNVVLET